MNNNVAGWRIVLLMLLGCSVGVYAGGSGDSRLGNGYAPRKQDLMFIESALASRDTLTAQRLLAMVKQVPANSLTNWVSDAQEHRIRQRSRSDPVTRIRSLYLEIVDDIDLKRRPPAVAMQGQFDEVSDKSFWIGKYMFTFVRSNSVGIWECNPDIAPNDRDDVMSTAVSTVFTRYGIVVYPAWNLLVPEDDLTRQREISEQALKRTAGGAIIMWNRPGVVYVPAIGENIPVQVIDGRIDEKELYRAKKTARRISRARLAAPPENPAEE